MRANSNSVAMVLVSTALLGVASSSAIARTNWQGEIMITVAGSAACNSDSWTVGGNALATLLPANIDDNGKSSFIAFHFNRRNAYSLEVNGALAKGKAYAGVAITSAGSNFPFSGSIVQHSQSPSTNNVTVNTKFITVTGQISNWAGTTGCTITYEGAFVRRR